MMQFPWECANSIQIKIEYIPSHAGTTCRSSASQFSLNLHGTPKQTKNPVHWGRDNVSVAKKDWWIEESMTGVHQKKIAVDTNKQTDGTNCLDHWESYLYISLKRLYHIFVPSTVVHLLIKSVHISLEELASNRMRKQAV